MLPDEACKPRIDVLYANALHLCLGADFPKLFLKVEREVLGESCEKKPIGILPVGKSHQMPRAVKRRHRLSSSGSARHFNSTVPGRIHDFALRRVKENTPLRKRLIHNGAKFLIGFHDSEA